MPITEQDLIDAGYKEHRKPKWCHDHATRFFQKAVLDGTSRKYFINVFEYDHRCIGLNTLSYMFETQFHYRQKGKDYFTDISVSDANNLLDAEEYLESIWKSTGADMYDEEY